MSQQNFPLSSKTQVFLALCEQCQKNLTQLNSFNGNNMFISIY